MSFAMIDPAQIGALIVVGGAGLTVLIGMAVKVWRELREDRRLAREMQRQDRREELEEKGDIQQHAGYVGLLRAHTRELSRQAKRLRELESRLQEEVTKRVALETENAELRKRLDRMKRRVLYLKSVMEEMGMGNLLHGPFDEDVTRAGQ